MNEINKIVSPFAPATLLKRHKAKVVFALGLSVIFLVSGYLMSDDLFFKQLIRSNRITTPEEAFAFVQSQVVYPSSPEMKTISGLTPRYMLTQKSICGVMRALFC
jgi:hypothetical protein